MTGAGNAGERHSHVDVAVAPNDVDAQDIEFPIRKWGLPALLQPVSQCILSDGRFAILLFWRVLPIAGGSSRSYLRTSDCEAEPGVCGCDGSHLRLFNAAAVC
jgi:hypothetical protein